MESQLAFELENKLLTLVENQKNRKKQLDYQRVGDDEKKEKKEDKNSLSINYIIVQKIPIKIKCVLQQNFQNLINLTIVNCDLRTFQNVPKLKNLKNLNVSKNSLRGSFEYLVKNRNLKYIDASSNLIVDFSRFQPLRILKNLSIFVKENPFQSKISEGETSHSKNYFLQQFKKLGIKYLQKSINTPPEIKQQQPKKVEKTGKITSNCQQMKQEILGKLLRSGRNPKLIEKYLYQYLNQEPNISRHRSSRRQLIQEEMIMPKKKKESERRVQQQMRIHQQRAEEIREERQINQYNRISFSIEEREEMPDLLEFQIDENLEQDEDIQGVDENIEDENEEENQMQFFARVQDQRSSSYQLSMERPFGHLRIPRMSAPIATGELSDESDSDDEDEEA